MTHQALYRHCCCFPCDNPIEQLPETLKISGSVSFQIKTCRKMKNYAANQNPLCNGTPLDVVCEPISGTPNTDFGGSNPESDPKCEDCVEIPPEYPSTIEWERESLLNVKYTFTGLLYKDAFASSSNERRYVGNSLVDNSESENSVNFSWDVNLLVEGEDWKSTLDCFQIDCCPEGCFPLEFEPEIPIICEGTQSVNDSYQQSGTNWFPTIKLLCQVAPLNDLDSEKENCNWIDFNIEDFKEDGSFFGKKITQIVIEGGFDPSVPNPISWPPELQNCPGKRLECQGFDTCDCEYVPYNCPPPCDDTERRSCVPLGIFGTLLNPFRDVYFVSKNFQNLYGDYICNRLSYSNPSNIIQKNFFNCNNPLVCPGFPEFPEEINDETWDGGDGWDGRFIRVIDSSPQVNYEYWITTNHTINTDETFVTIGEESSTDR